MECRACPATHLAPNTPNAGPDVYNIRRLTTTSRKDDGVTEDESQNDTFPGRVLRYISLEKEGADYACLEPTKRRIS